ncbi:MAG: response regulator [Alphaproteobacteria bacterium]|nr:response regulator [Alphaproteobacteria bacterium]
MSSPLLEPVIDIYIADPEKEMRQTVRGTLRTLKFNSFEEFADAESLRDRMARSYPDLLIADFDLPGGDVCKMIQDIRTNELGPNPFVPIIMTTWNKDATTIRRVIDCGVDGLLLKPMSAGALMKHLEVILVDRKAFIVTSSYIGPDRRKDPGHKSNIPLMDVPNTLKAKKSGQHVDIEMLDRLIAENILDVNAERLRRNAFEISFLLGLILPAYEEDVVSVMTRKQLHRIRVVSIDISSRVRGTEYAHISDLCKTMNSITKSVSESFEEPPSKDFQLMKPVSDAILAGINPDRSASAMASEISSSISTFKNRRS